MEPAVALLQGWKHVPVHLDHSPLAVDAANELGRGDCAVDDVVIADVDRDVRRHAGEARDERNARFLRLVDDTAQLIIRRRHIDQGVEATANKRIDLIVDRDHIAAPVEGFDRPSSGLGVLDGGFHHARNRLNFSDVREDRHLEIRF
jgi:hypothetical protein